MRLLTASTRPWVLALAALAVSQFAWAAASEDKKRIAEARAQADADLATQEVECQTRFAVTPCLLDARERHRAIVEPLRRDELTIDERERKQRAADRLGRLSRKAEAAREAASVAASIPAPELSDAGSKASKPLLPIRPRLRSGSASEPLATGEAASAPPAEPLPEKPRRGHASKRLTPAPDPDAAQRAEDRVRQAEERKARVLARNAERTAKKPPAVPLPVPGEPAAATPSSVR